MINPLKKYALDYTKPDPILLKNLTIETHEKVHGAHMLSCKITGRFLKMLVQISKACLVVDLGTFTGYSALSLAEGLPSHGKLITLEKSTECLKIARKYFHKSPHGYKIELISGFAENTLPQIPNNIDLIFMDADKQLLINYYEILLPKLKPGGIIVVDNVSWHGKVLVNDRRSRNLHKFNDYIVKDNRVENVILPFFDGVNLVRKK
jgi:caffeoyl-CoA O-methyltransferase